MRRLWIVVVVVLVAACGGEGEDASSPPGEAQGSASEGSDPGTSAETMPLMAMPPKMLAGCTRFEELEPACPAMVPEIAKSAFSSSKASREATELWVFFAEWNVPRRGLSEKNAPPQFAHVNAYAAAPDMLVQFESEELGEDAPSGTRTSGLTLGERTWNGRTGELVLAPSYPHGGTEGDHLIFEWTQDDLTYSLSLHAWDSLDETEATLEAMVASIQ